MNDDPFSFGHWYRLASCGAAGLSCDTDGVALGPVPLVAAGPGRRYIVRPEGEAARALALAYGAVAPERLARCMAGLGSVAKALDRNDGARAAIVAVQMRFPAITPEGMAKLAAASDLHKYNPDQPRVPAGNSDGGQWTGEQQAANPGINKPIHISQHAAKLTKREVGNIVYNETQSLSGPGLDEARTPLRMQFEMAKLGQR